MCATELKDKIQESNKMESKEGGYCSVIILLY